MHKRSLRTLIAVYIAVLLLIAVLFIDFVLLTASQKKEMQARIVLHQTITTALRNSLSYKPTTFPDNHLTQYTKEETNAALNRLLDAAGVSPAVITAADGQMIYQTQGTDPALLRELRKSAQQTAMTGKARHCFRGSTWGVLWKKSRYLLIATPITISDATDNLNAAFVSAVDLEYIYADQRKTQRIIFFYNLINICFLTFIGTTAISRLAVRPINRLVHRAEEYQDDNELAFLYGQEKNEFRKLSNSLNQMVIRISKDKKRLKESLAELQKANMEITAHQNDLIRAEKLASVGRLAAGIAHEIGNPISIVLGYLAMLNQSSLSEKEREDYIIRCEKEINRINTIIRDLLDFSRPTIREACAVSVHDIISETLQMMSVQPVMRDIDLITRLDAATDTVTADPDRLRQIFVNLIINAADAIASGETADSGDIKTGQIIVSSNVTEAPDSQGKQFLVVSVADNGPGITDKNMDNIFDPFYTTKEPGKGTGLGLSVCFMIIENLGGTIKAGAREEGGTTMTVALPLATDSDIR